MKPEQSPERLSPWAGHVTTGRTGNPEGEPGVTISLSGARDTIQVETRPEYETFIAKALGELTGLSVPDSQDTVTRDGKLTLCRLAPGRWMLAGATGSDIESRLKDRLSGQPVAITALGHGRAVVFIEGPAVRSLLAKGCGLDFHLSSFPADSCAQTSLFGCSVLLDCRGAEEFEIHVSRSYAAHLLEVLIDEAGEFGVLVRN